MFMNKEMPLAREYLTEEEWLRKIFKKSKSQGSLDRAQTSLKLFDVWCKYKLDIPDPDISDLEVEYQKKMKGLWAKVNPNPDNGKLRWKAEMEFAKAVSDRYAPIYKEARAKIIKQYSDWFEQDKADIQSICTSLTKFVDFCTEEHPDIKVTRHATFKAKKGSTIKGYFQFIKKYLMKCHGIRITSD